MSVVYKCNVKGVGDRRFNITVNQEGDKLTLEAVDDRNKLEKWVFDEKNVYAVFNGYKQIDTSYSNLVSIKKHSNCIAVDFNDNGTKKGFLIWGDKKVNEMVLNKITTKEPVKNNNLEVANGDLKYNIVKIFIIVCMVILLFFFIGSLDNSSSADNWNQLTEEEKEWYKDNYGDGKMEEINDAIDDYRNK